LLELSEGKNINEKNGREKNNGLTKLTKN